MLPHIVQIHLLWGNRVLLETVPSLYASGTTCHNIPSTKNTHLGNITKAGHAIIIFSTLDCQCSFLSFSLWNTIGSSMNCGRFKIYASFLLADPLQAGSCNLLLIRFYDKCLLLSANLALFGVLLRKTCRDIAYMTCH